MNNSSGKYRNKYRIPSARAIWHNYNAGIYFITICTANKVHYFGEIINDEMQVSAVGKYVTQNIKNISIHYPYAEIPLYVVMPNHIHLMVVINEDSKEGDCSDGENVPDIVYNVGKLSIVVGGLRSAITRLARENGNEFAWQTRFHDHIIRNADECNRIAEYIENNVLTWATDVFHTP